MIRFVTAAGLLLAAASCDREPDTAADLPELTVIVDE
jgi:hypothetical protein